MAATRRSFLTWLGLAPVVVALPAVAATPTPDVMFGGAAGGGMTPSTVNDLSRRQMESFSGYEAIGQREDLEDVIC